VGKRMLAHSLLRNVHFLDQGPVELDPLTEYTRERFISDIT